MKNSSQNILKKLRKEYQLASQRPFKPQERWLVIVLCVGIMTAALYTDIISNN